MYYDDDDDDDDDDRQTDSFSHCRNFRCLVTDEV